MDLAKIKEMLGTVFKYILLPFFMVAGVIFYLWQRVNTLKSEVAEANAEKELGKRLNKIEEAKEVADDKEANYHRIADEYRKQHPGGGTRPGDDKTSG